MAGKLYCLRHGQSLWNQLNIFTGWVDIPLSLKGVDEALLAGERLAHVEFNQVFTSTLIRAETTAALVLAKNRSQKVAYRYDPQQKAPYGSFREGMVPIYQDAALNERMYGKLQGMNKEEAKKIYGAEQVQLWRRSYDAVPPGGESLKMTKARTLPYFNEVILPCLVNKETVLIVAHGNSLRSIVMQIKGLSEEEIIRYELETGVPICFEYREGVWKEEKIQ